ncbi:hypothetical protein B0I37DRAFT_415856 [Chaetomium sp. MPI-CAGE-AT-0009]|nr:hypothetical protein B0I37DRAFT_415856 [Chaetomium sp. MPI-CAGE-AT-0009]
MAWYFVPATLAVMPLDGGAHQNRCYVKEIEAFNAKLAAMKDKSMILEEDKEMAKYLSNVYNFANKGIKGCGNGCKQPTYDGLPYCDFSYPVAYSLGGYSMYSGLVNDTSSATLEAGYGAAYLDDQCSQELAFADRFY